MTVEIVLNTVELARLQALIDSSEVQSAHLWPPRITIRAVPTGVGSCITVECPELKIEKTDISDYGSW